MQHARTLLEHRYLAGRGARFPNTLADWQDLCAGVQLLAGSDDPSSAVASVTRRAVAQAASIAEITWAASLARVGETGAAALRIQGSSSASSSLQPPTSPVGTVEIGTGRRVPEPRPSAHANAWTQPKASQATVTAAVALAVR